MILITILICLALQRYWHLSISFHELPWFENYLHVIRTLFGNTSLWRGTVGIVVIAAPLFILVGLISLLFYGHLFNILYFIFSLIVLWLVLDGHDLSGQLAEYFQACQQGDEHAAMQYGAIFVEEIPDKTLPSMTRAITRELFYHADQHIFSVLFWYVILGPAGAVLYYSVGYIARTAKFPHSAVHPFAENAIKIQAILDWIPVRIVGLTYALAGRFNQAFSYWWENLNAGLNNAREFAGNIGLVALELDAKDTTAANFSENKMALGLIDRTIIIWIVMIAVFTLGAWIS